jgi:hexokinase
LNVFEKFRGKEMEKSVKINDILRPFFTNEEKLQVIRDKILEQMFIGLKQDGQNESSIQPFPILHGTNSKWFVNGTILVLNLENHKMLGIHLVRITDGKIVQSQERSQRIEIPDEFLGGEKFDFIVASVDSFYQNGSATAMTDLNMALIMPILDEQMTRQLVNAFTKRQINLCIKTFINHTTGCFVNAVVNHGPQCRIAVNVDRVSEAFYLEDSNLIDTQWANFGDHGELDHVKTIWDTKLDSESSNPGQQMFQKLTSAKYFGQLVTRIMLSFAEQRLIFENLDYSVLKKNLSVIDMRTMCDLTDINACKTSLQKAIGDPKGAIKDEDFSIIVRICTRVTERAAKLIAAGIAAIIKKIKPQDNHVIMVADGYTFKSNDSFTYKVKSTIDRLLDNEVEVEMLFCNAEAHQGAAYVHATQ